ncbi:MAG: biliverdin-producing heme oxygenase [Thiohalospira sp.]
MQTESIDGFIPPSRMEVRSLLREGTAQLHAAIEDTPVVTRVMGDSITEADYRALLGRLHGFHSPLEAGLEGCCPALAVERPFRPRAPRLARDLRARGIDPGGLPRCPRTPVPQTRAEFLGIAWVLEGSALGARVIRRQVGERLGPDAIGPFHAEENPDDWRDFLARLEDGVCTPDQRTEALRGARATFTSLLHWLEEAAS